jgi:hypothetical protein
MSSITSAASRWPLVASSSRLAASRRRADAGSYTISGGAGGATRTASARRTHSRASINDGRGARRGGDGQHQGADRLKAPQPDAGDSTEEQAGQRTPDAGRDGSAGGCADLTFAIRDHRRRSPPTPVLVYSRPGAPNARPRNRRPPTPAIPSSSRLSSVMLRAFGRTAQTTEPNPLAGRAGQAPFIEILLSTPPSPTIRAACHGTGLGRPRSRDGQRLYQGRQSARARCAWPVENEAPGNRVPFVAPQRESRPGGRCGTHDWGSGMNGRDPAELRPQGQPFSPAGWIFGTAPGAGGLSLLVYVSVICQGPCGGR